MTIIHIRTSKRGLNIALNYIAAVWVLKLAFMDGGDFALLPTEAYEPVGFLRWLPHSFYFVFQHAHFWWALQFGAIASLACIIALKRKAVPVWFSCVLITVFEGFFRGYAGHMTHVDILLLYSLYIFGAYFVVEKRTPDSWTFFEEQTATKEGMALATVFALVCLLYCMVGVHRFTHGGYKVFASDSILYWALRNCYQAPEPTWGWGRWLLDNHYLESLLRLGFPFITLMEVLAPICIVERRFRIFFVVIMGSFHFLSWFLLNIVFWETMMLYILFYDFSVEQHAAAGSVKTTE